MPITNTKFKGRDLILKVETSPSVYTIVGGLQANSLSIGSEAIDITDKSDDNWRKLLSGGIRTLSLSASGFITSAASFDKCRDAAHAATPLNAILAFANGKAYSGPFLITSCDLNGESKDAQKFSISMESMNTPFYGIASAFPTLDLNFAESGSIQPTMGTAAMTFTRASSALYRDVDGYLKTALANVPRFEHDANGNRMGYLPEPQSTNLLLRSQEFDNASWVKGNATVTANAEIAPDQTATADHLVEDGATASHNVTQAVSKAASAIQYTASVYVKAKGRSKVRLVFDSTNSSQVDFDLSAGTAGTPAIRVGAGFTGMSASIEPYRDGFYRCTFTATSDTATAFTLYVFALTAAGVESYAGTNGSVALALWGAQVEVQPQTTSYIVTTSAQVTRSMDVLSAPTASISGFSATEGTLYVEAYEPATGADGAGRVALNDGTGNEEIAAFRNASNGTERLFAVDGGAVVADFTAAAVGIGSLLKNAIGFKANDFAASFNGGGAQTDTVGGMPTFTTLLIGAAASGGIVRHGRPIKRISYYNTRVANADLVALTG